jgi:hypothetical protein
MSTKPLKQPLPGEHLLRVEPRPAPFVEAGWLSRPHLYTGRALGTEVLAAEQRGRSGRLALSGQRVSPGVVEGLEVRLEKEKVGSQEHWYFHLSPGLGLAASGEDVVVPRLLRIPTYKVLAWKPEVTPFNLQALSTLNSKDTQAGLSVAMLVLVPVVVQREEEAPSSSPSEVDPDAESFEDPQLVDGCVPVLCAWPERWSKPQVDAQWRGKLAHMLFDYERQRNPEELAPWEELGVPVALVGFEPAELVDGAPRPVFADRASVVRQGGAPRRRSALVALSGSPLLWQARIQQFSEHLADLGPQAVAEGTAMQAFSRLPPVGVLPPQAVDFRHWTQRFFPSRFIIEAVPVPLEQLDAVAQASAALAPLRAAEPERVRLLVPVPQVHFEPRLLQSEFLEVAFPRAVDSGLRRLGEWRRRQDNLRGKSTLLVDAMEGKAASPLFPTPDPAAIPAEHVGVAPADPATYGPEEAAYGTRGQLIPALEDTLGRWGFEGSWSSARKMHDRRADEVMIASDPETGRIFAFVYASPSIILRYEAGAWQPPEDTYDIRQIHTMTRSGRNFFVIDMGVFPANNYTGPLSAHVRVRRYTPYGLSGQEAAPIPAGAEWYHGSYHVSAVPRGNGFIDVFATMTPTTGGFQLWRWTWREGSEGSEGSEGFVGAPQLVFSLQQSCAGLAAVSRAPGQVDVLLLNNAGPANGRAFTLLHLSGTLSADGSSYTFSSPTTVVPLNSSKFYWNLRVCSPFPERLDVFLHEEKEIIHHWLEQSWRTEVLFATSEYQYPWSVQAVCPRPGRIDLVWGIGNSFVPDLRIMHRRWDGGWQPERLIVDKGWKPNANVTFNNIGVAPGVLGVVEVLWARGPEGSSHITKLADDARSIVINHGVRGLIAQQTQLVKRLDDFIQSNRLRVQSDVQRVRQIMISGNTEESRLAASPVLSRVVSSATSSVEFNLETYLSRRKQEGAFLQSDAQEAMQDAATTKRNVLEQLVLLVREAGMDVASLPVPGVAKVTRGSDNLLRVTLEVVNQVATKRIIRENVRLSALVDSPEALADALERVEEEPEALARAIAEARLTYSGFDYFTTAVQLLEHTLLLLRGVERQLEGQLRRTNAFQATLRQVEGFKSELDKRLKVVDGEVAESRQDVTVARALMAEELARIESINERRQKVLEEHVRLLVFQRPREKWLELEAPVRVLDSALVQDVLPEVLASTEAAPPELWSFVELLKDAPLNWLTAGPALLGRLDRLELLQRALERARERAGLRTPPSLPVRPAAPSAKAQQGLSRIFVARQEVVARRRSQTAAVELLVLRQRSWRELQREALELLTPGDLMDMANGRSDVGRESSAELERLSKVATGLYQRFGEVPPLLRLEWVEDFSQYDAAVDLHDLARLPRWEQVEPRERREMQRLVDWLFSRVSTREPEAVSLVNDLVRACLLLASHAPVDELVGAHVSRPVAARVGDLVELALDPARVRIGMHVMLSTGGHMVQAVVEDLSTGTAQARVFSATAPVVHLPEKTAATLSDPGRGKGTLLPRLGAKR